MANCKYIYKNITYDSIADLTAAINKEQNENPHLNTSFYKLIEPVYSKLSKQNQIKFLNDLKTGTVKYVNNRLIHTQYPMIPMFKDPKSAIELLIHHYNVGVLSFKISGDVSNFYYNDKLVKTTALDLDKNILVTNNIVDNIYYIPKVSLKGVSFVETQVTPNTNTFDVKDLSIDYNRRSSNENDYDYLTRIINSFKTAIYGSNKEDTLKLNDFFDTIHSAVTNTENKIRIVFVDSLEDVTYNIINNTIEISNRFNVSTPINNKIFNKKILHALIRATTRGYSNLNIAKAFDNIRQSVMSNIESLNIGLDKKAEYQVYVSSLDYFITGLLTDDSFYSYLLNLDTFDANYENNKDFLSKLSTFHISTQVYRTKEAEYVDDIIIHSGLAKGSDIIASHWFHLKGVPLANITHYIPQGDRSNSRSYGGVTYNGKIIQEGSIEYETGKALINQLHSNGFIHDNYEKATPYVRGLQYRNTLQILNSNQVFAIAPLQDNKEGVVGGTNTAIKLAIALKRKDIYVIDVKKSKFTEGIGREYHDDFTPKLYKYDYNLNKFVLAPNEDIKLSQNIAVIGTRDIELYKKTGYNDTKQLGDGNNDYIGHNQFNKVKELFETVIFKNIPGKNPKQKVSRNKSINILKSNLTKESIEANSQEGYFFTDNLQAYLVVQNIDPAPLGIPVPSGKLILNVNNSQAIARTNSEGVKFQNTFSIITKKYQQTETGAFTSKDDEGFFKDTAEDFELFKQYNERSLQQAKDSSYNVFNILEAGLAISKAGLPKRFAEWLNNQLILKFGIHGTLVEREVNGTIYYGIMNIRKYVNTTSNSGRNKNNISGIEINSYQTGLGNDLTNVHHVIKAGEPTKFDIIPSNKTLILTDDAKSKWGKSVEAWYKSNKSETKNIPEGEEADKYDMELMIGLITDKLLQYPELISKINNRGGLEFLNKSTHNMGNGRWSSKNPKNMFMTALKQAYQNAINIKNNVKPVVEDLDKWSELKDATQPYTTRGVVVTRIQNSDRHFGNPFIGSKRRDKNGKLIESKPDNITIFNTIPEADQAYRDWLLGTKHQNIEPLRRKWILEQINSGRLDSETLLYYKPDKVENIDGTEIIGGYHSHADTLAEIVDEIRSPLANNTSTPIEKVDNTPETDDTIDTELFSIKLNKFEYFYNPVDDTVYYVSKNGKSHTVTGETSKNKVLVEYGKSKNYEIREYNDTKYINVNDTIIDMTTFKTVRDSNVLSLFSNNTQLSLNFAKSVTKGPVSEKAIYVKNSDQVRQEIEERDITDSVIINTQNSIEILKGEADKLESISNLVEIEGFTIDLAKLGILFQLSDEQIISIKEIIQIFKNSLNNSNPEFNLKDYSVVLSGSAGTGKSTITSVLVHWFELYSINNNLDTRIVTTGTTHQAKRVLADITGNNSKTIQSHLNLTVNNSLSEDYSDTIETQYTIESPKHQELKPEILFIDESSMISNELYRSINEYISEGNGNRFVIFIGDKKQAPPINKKTQTYSLIYDPALGLPLIELTEVKRQTKQSDTIASAASIISNNENNLGTNSFIPSFTQIHATDSNIISVTPEVFKELVLNLSVASNESIHVSPDVSNNSYFRFISYSNNQVDNMNVSIRHKLKKNIQYSKNLTTGDVIESNTNVGLENRRRYIVTDTNRKIESKEFDLFKVITGSRMAILTNKYKNHPKLLNALKYLKANYPFLFFDYEGSFEDLPDQYKALLRYSVRGYYVTLRPIDESPVMLNNRIRKFVLDAPLNLKPIEAMLSVMKIEDNYANNIELYANMAASIQYIASIAYRDENPASKFDTDLGDMFNTKDLQHILYDGIEKDFLSQYLSLYNINLNGEYVDENLKNGRELGIIRKSISYGYGSTIHSAQGATIRIVAYDRESSINTFTSILNINNRNAHTQVQKNTDYLSYQKLDYVALSRFKDVLIVPNHALKSNGPVDTNVKTVLKTIKDKVDTSPVNTTRTLKSINNNISELQLNLDTYKFIKNTLDYLNSNYKGTNSISFYGFFVKEFKYNELDRTIYAELQSETSLHTVDYIITTLVSNDVEPSIVNITSFVNTLEFNNDPTIIKTDSNSFITAAIDGTQQSRGSKNASDLYITKKGASGYGILITSDDGDTFGYKSTYYGSEVDLRNKIYNKSNSVLNITKLSNTSEFLAMADVLESIPLHENLLVQFDFQMPVSIAYKFLVFNHIKNMNNDDLLKMLKAYKLEGLTGEFTKAHLILQNKNLSTDSLATDETTKKQLSIFNSTVLKELANRELTESEKRSIHLLYTEIGAMYGIYIEGNESFFKNAESIIPDINNTDAKIGLSIASRLIRRSISGAKTKLIKTDAVHDSSIRTKSSNVTITDPTTAIKDVINKILNNKSNQGRFMLAVDMLANYKHVESTLTEYYNDMPVAVNIFANDNRLKCNLR